MEAVTLSGSSASFDSHPATAIQLPDTLFIDRQDYLEIVIEGQCVAIVMAR